MTEDEMFGWHHQLNGQEFEHTNKCPNKHLWRLFIFLLVALFELSHSCVGYSDIFMSLRSCQTFKSFSPIPTRLF